MPPSTPPPQQTVYHYRGGLGLAAIFLLLAVIYAAHTYRVVRTPTEVTVRGSAKQEVEADWIVWRSDISLRSPNLIEGYATLSTQVEQVRAFLVEQGIPASAIFTDSVNNWKEFERDQYGNQLQNVLAYNLTQQVRVESADVANVEAVSREVTQLIADGIDISSYAPEYIYTKLQDLRVQLLEEASRDGKRRAEVLAKESGGTLGALRIARMGVFQLLPRYSVDVLDSGSFDTSSKMKDAMAVVTLTYDVAGAGGWW